MNNSETLHGDKIYYGELQVRAMPGVHEAAFAALKEFVEPNRKILEIGSGMGALTRRINEGGYDIVASGIDPDDYRYADVSFMRLDLSKPIDSQLRGAYGALVATEVIEHVENVFLFFRNAHDLLTHGGTFILTTPNALSLFSRLQFLKSGRIAFCNEELMGSWGHIQIIPEWLLRKAAADAGFECLKSLGVGTRRYDLAPAWHRWVDSLSPIANLIFRQDFENQHKGSNLLMALRKT